MTDEARDPTFAEVLEQLRHARGLKPAELARELKEYEGNVSRWRRGGGIDVGKVDKIADYFGVDRSWLRSLAGYPDSPPSLAKERLAPEFAMWRAIYDEVEKEVPRSMWLTYIDACLSIARALGQIHPAPLNTPNTGSLNTPLPEKGKGAPDDSGGTLTVHSPAGSYAQQFTRLSALLPA